MTTSNETGSSRPETGVPAGEALKALGKGEKGCHLCDGCGWSSPWSPCVCWTRSPAAEDNQASAQGEERFTKT